MHQDQIGEASSDAETIGMLELWRNGLHLRRIPAICSICTLCSPCVARNQAQAQASRDTAGEISPKPESMETRRLGVPRPVVHVNGSGLEFAVVAFDVFIAHGIFLHVHAEAV